jgi:hypothetical protein
MIGAQIETRKCYNSEEVRHLSKACPKSPKKRETCVCGGGSLEVVIVVVVEATGQI